MRLPPAPPSETKLPEPQVDERQAAEREIRKFYRDKLADLQTPAKKAALANELSRVGLGTKDDPAHRFVLLSMACSLWAEAGDMDQPLAMVDRIGGWYDVDVLAMKADVLSSV